MSYIKREDAKKAIMEYIGEQTVSKYATAEECRAARHGAEGAFNELDYLPTADVVEVVRCKDCAHYHEMEGFDFKGRKVRHCAWHSALRGEDDYCSDGIRRNGRREENEG